MLLACRRFPTKYIGTRNEGELNRLLLATVMVRRLKKDVLKHLPAKIRQQVIAIYNVMYRLSTACR